MKVLHISARADHGGGPEHIYSLLKYAGPELTQYVASPDDPPYADRFSRLARGRYCRIPHRQFSIPALARLIRWARAESIELIHSHGKGAGLYSRAMKPALSVPVVHTWHGIHQAEYKAASWQLYLALERMLGHATDCTIAVSRSEAETVAQLGLAPDAKITLINNGVEIPSRPNMAAALRSTPLVIAVTRFEGQKNPAQLLEIAARLRQQWRGEFTLEILGAGPLLEECQQQTRDRGLSDIIQFKGAVEDVRSHLGRASVFLSSSLGEGLPLAVLEAMSERLPCVLSDVRGHRELLTDNDAGYLYPLERSDLAAEKLRELLSHPRERARRGEIACEFVRNNYNVEIMAKKTAQLYAKLTAKGGTAGHSSGTHTPL